MAQVASGYVYYVSLKGVTGSGALDTAAVQAMLPRIRQHVSVPVGVGFGIRDAQTAQTVGQVADAVITANLLQQMFLGTSTTRTTGAGAGGALGGGVSRTRGIDYLSPRLVARS